MKFDVEVLGSICDVLVDCQQPAGIIVLMDVGLDGALEGVMEVEFVDQFQQQSSYWDEVPEAVREG